MKKIITLLAVAELFFFSAENASAQATNQLNIGLIGVSYEVPVTSDITLAPFAGTNLNISYFTLGVKANYYFDNLLDLPEEFDIYGGANAGYGLGFNNNANDFDIGLQIGFRWFWSEKMGLYLEGGGGKLGGTAGLGITIRM